MNHQTTQKIQIHSGMSVYESFSTCASATAADGPRLGGSEQAMVARAAHAPSDIATVTCYAAAPTNTDLQPDLDVRRI
jgi:hypothetical protein